ncbi:MAG: putative transporter [Bacteroidales bacterium]|nr:putative transporter [Bacteroidales bacterium]
MNWIYELLTKESVAQTIIIYSFVIAIGVVLGKIKVLNISLGITFVLFTGIAVGHFGFDINHVVLDIARDFGLILFVFSIGMQVGPGFFASFRKGGIKLNLLAMGIVVLGASTTVVLHFTSGVSMPVMAGIMSGAVTSTPGLGAAQQAVIEVFAGKSGTAIPDISLGYAVTYPFGVLGIIITMLLIKRITRTDITRDLAKYNELQHPEETLPVRISILITNPAIEGRKVQDLKEFLKHETVVSRIYHSGEVSGVTSGSELHLGDIVHFVAQKGDVDDLIRQFGKKSEIDLAKQPGTLMSKQILVTHVSASGKSLAALKLRLRFGVNITRVYRAGIELLATPALKLQLGDKITIVGEENAIENVAQLLGNSLKRLNEPNLFPIFIGILIGALLGSLPLTIPGMHTTFKLGLAGGPLIIAILLSKYGYKLSLVSYTTPSANLMLREVGIVLFLASIGLKAGENFIPTLMSGDGFTWIGYGMLITFVPIFITGIFSALVLKQSFFEVCGLLAGSMTDTPALAFANSIAQCEAPAVAYATVYPLVMFLRIVIAQLLIMLFA